MRVFATVMTFASVAFAGLVTRQSPQAPFPAVTYPNANSPAVWVVGSPHNVTWKSPGSSRKRNNWGRTKIFLSKGGIVDFENPLASDFPLEANRVEVITPDVVPGSDYQVILNRGSQSAPSAFFTIVRRKHSIPESVDYPSATIEPTATEPVPVPSEPVDPSVSEPEVEPSEIASLSAEASSVHSGVSAVQSGVSQTLSNALTSAGANSSPTSGTSNGSESGNAATVLVCDFTAVKALVTVGAVALSAGAVLVF